MNRNVESHFSQLPKVNIQRSIFDRSFSHKTSLNVGDLVPIYIDEVLPGDTFHMTTSKVIRLQTLVSPVMDNIYLDCWFFFVPNRLSWEHWQQFCGENTESAWAPETTFTIPKIKSPEGGFAVGSIADYFGIPPLVEFSSGNRIPSALPFRAYALICDNFFRDQNLSDPLNIPLGDANQQGSNGTNYIDDVANGGMPFKVAKYHDYFTSCMPDVQKGPPVSFPIDFTPFSGELPVLTGDVFDTSLLNPVSLHATKVLSSDPPSFDLNYSRDVRSNFSNGALTFTDETESYSGLAFDNLRVNIPPVDPLSSSISINDLRLAFSLQRYLEAMARSGSRYIEILSGIFGVTSPDARLHLPEYLGGNRIPLNVHQVTNTAQAEKDFLGDLGAMSLTHDLHADFQKSFTEHGYIIGVAAIRYDHTYSQGLERFWSRNSFTDFYMPLFANLGEQPVYTSEIYFDPDNQDDVFGYQEAWADYRFKPNRISGELRPGVPNTLASWHLGDYYSEAPTLSDEWIREDKINVDRVLAVTSEVSNQAWMDIYFNCKCTRPMPMYSIPAIEAGFN